MERIFAVLDHFKEASVVIVLIPSWDGSPKLVARWSDCPMNQVWDSCVLR